MARKAKKQMHKMPKLSFLDHLIYWIVFLLIFVFSFGSLGLSYYLHNMIAFADEMVIASVEHSSILWSLFTWFLSFIIPFALWLQPYGERYPIFGRKNFQYGPPAWPKIYPVFMKNKPYVWVSEKAKKGRRKLIAILFLVVAISWIPYPWSLYGRDCLYADGSIGQYNMFNSKVREFHSGEIDSVTFEVYYHSNTNTTGDFVVRVNLSPDTGKDYVFLYNDFRDAFDGEPRNWLKEMLQQKERYIPEIIQYAGKDKLDYVVYDNELTEAETKMLYQLFGLP